MNLLFVFTALLASLLASCVSGATWGTKSFAFHGRIAAGRGAFSLAHLICMQGTFNRLLMDTAPGQPVESLIPHHSEVMEMSLGGGGGLHPHAVLFVHLTFIQWLFGAMEGIRTFILDECEADLVAASLITPALSPGMHSSPQYTQRVEVVPQKKMQWSSVIQRNKSLL